VWTGEDYRRIKSETHCDAVMIARAAIGNPFVFEEIDAVRRGVEYRHPDVDRVVTVLVDHLDREIALKGPRTGMNRMKRHFAAYLKGCPGVAELRKRVFATNDRDEVVAAFEAYRTRNAGFRPEPLRGRRAA